MSTAMSPLKRTLRIIYGKTPFIPAKQVGNAKCSIIPAKFGDNRYLNDFFSKANPSGTNLKFDLIAGNVWQDQGLPDVECSLSRCHCAHNDRAAFRTVTALLVIYSSALLDLEKVSRR